MEPASITTHTPCQHQPTTADALRTEVPTTAHASPWNVRATARSSLCGAAGVVSAVTRTLDLGAGGTARETRRPQHDTLHIRPSKSTATLSTFMTSKSRFLSPHTCYRIITWFAKMQNKIYDFIVALGQLLVRETPLHCMIIVTPQSVSGKNSASQHRRAIPRINREPVSGLGRLARCASLDNLTVTWHGDRLAIRTCFSMCASNATID